MAYVGPAVAAARQRCVTICCAPWHAQVVLAPVVIGAFLNQKFPSTVARAAKFSPCIATLLIALIGKVTRQVQAPMHAGMWSDYAHP